MEGKAVVKTQSMLGDLVELLAKAILSGIGVAIAMSLAILALSASAQAAGETQAGIEVIETSFRGNQPGSVAPTPSNDAQAASVGALWATGKAPGPPDEATLQMLLGLIALMSAALVAVIGRVDMALADRGV
jgi:hypothetical protein